MADDWYTPKWVFDDLGIDFDLDVCAPKEKLEWIPAKKHFSVDVDGLSQQWGGVVWMNPPYSKPSPWIDRFLEHNNGVALVPMSKSAWFQKVWQSEAEIVLLPTAMKFEMPDGGKKQIFMQTILIGLGDVAKNALRNEKFGRIR